MSVLSAGFADKNDILFCQEKISLVLGAFPLQRIASAVVIRGVTAANVTRDMRHLEKG